MTGLNAGGASGEEDVSTRWRESGSASETRLLAPVSRGAQRCGRSNRRGGGASPPPRHLVSQPLPPRPLAAQITWQQLLLQRDETTSRTGHPRFTNNWLHWQVTCNYLSVCPRQNLDFLQACLQQHACSPFHMNAKVLVRTHANR